MISFFPALEVREVNSEVQYFEMQHRAAAAAAMVLGTLLAATIVANQGNDNYDAAGRWAMAEAGSREDGQVSNRDVARESPEAMQPVLSKSHEFALSFSASFSFSIVFSLPQLHLFNGHALGIVQVVAHQ